MSKEASAKRPSPSLDRANAAPFWDDVFLQEELSVTLDTTAENSQKARDRSV